MTTPQTKFVAVGWDELLPECAMLLAAHPAQVGWIRVLEVGRDRWRETEPLLRHIITGRIRLSHLPDIRLVDGDKVTLYRRRHGQYELMPV